MRNARKRSIDTLPGKFDFKIVPRASADPSSDVGYGGANPYGFLRAGSERGSKTADSLQSLQQAVSARDLGLRLSGQQGSGSMPYPEALQAQPEGQRTDWAFQGQRSTLPGSAKSSLPSPYAPLQSSPPSGDSSGPAIPSSSILADALPLAKTLRCACQARLITIRNGCMIVAELTSLVILQITYPPIRALSTHHL